LLLVIEKRGAASKEDIQQLMSEKLEIECFCRAAGVL